MDSPQPNSNNNSNNNNNIATSSSSSVSPTVKESPFFSYLRNLSPIKSANASKYVQRFSQTNNYHHVPPPPVFTSPRTDQLREPTFIIREETDSESYVHLNHESLIHCFQKEDHHHDQDKSCSPAACCIDDYLTDPPLDVEPLTANPNPNPSHLPHYNYMPLQSDDHVNSNMILHPFSGAQQHVPQIVRAYKDPPQSSRPALRGSVKVKEADQQQRGIRRHLQFGITMSCKNTSSETNDTANASLPDCLANFESLVPHHSGQAGGNVTFLSSFCLSQSVRSAQYGHDIPACIPSGLGFPSSGITRPTCIGDLIASKQLASNLHEQASDRNHNSAKDLLVYAHVHDDQQLSATAGTVGSATYPMNTMPRSCDFLCVTPSEQQLVPYEGRTIALSNSDMVGELNQVSPKRNRKRAKHSNDIEGCKRCNCKRSKCLKLYCECFAAGVYCLESCACEDCYNRPEYEDTVLDIRQQIEARNPLAFAPKVVKQATNSPANVVEEGNWTTPSSARHKRGCNCKKSKCLKKYCECYQSGVGCSSGCRCEGCKNSYGKKPVSIYTRAEKWENSTHEQLDTSEIQDDFIKAGRAHQFSSTWEEFADTTPVSHCHSGSLATSRSLNIGDSSKVSQAQAHQGSNMLLLAGYHHSHHSPSPKLLYSSKAMPELSPDSLLCNMLKEDDTPQMLNRTSTPTKMVKAGSPNQKRVSPPQIRSQELRSSSSKGLRSVRKFNLPDMPSFPPLTPYSKSKDGDQQIDGD